MRNLHYAMMGVLAIAVIAVAVGVTQPMQLAAEAQHGQAIDEQSHFARLAELLELTDAQQAALAAPFAEAFAAMEALHRIHDSIAPQLTKEQRDKLAQMVHENLAASFTTHAHHMGGHGGGQN